VQYFADNYHRVAQKPFHFGLVIDLKYQERTDIGVSSNAEGMPRLRSCALARTSRAA